MCSQATNSRLEHNAHRTQKLMTLFTADNGACSAEQFYKTCDRCASLLLSSVLGGIIQFTHFNHGYRCSSRHHYQHFEHLGDTIMYEDWEALAHFVSSRRCGYFVCRMCCAHLDVAF
jgi:hypothetical protein